MSHLFTGHWSKHVTWSSPKSMRMYVLFTGHEGVNNSNSMENGAIESTQAGIFSSRREGNWKLYTQHCQCRVPGAGPHLCTLSPQGDKPKHSGPPFLMLMLCDDSFTRCDSHHWRPPPPLLGFPLQTPVLDSGWSQLRTDPFRQP